MKRKRKRLNRLKADLSSDDDCIIVSPPLNPRRLQIDLEKDGGSARPIPVKLRLRLSNHTGVAGENTDTAVRKSARQEGKRKVKSMAAATLTRDIKARAVSLKDKPIELPAFSPVPKKSTVDIKKIEVENKATWAKMQAKASLQSSFLVGSVPDGYYLQRSSQKRASVVTLVRAEDGSLTVKAPEMQNEGKHKRRMLKDVFKTNNASSKQYLSSRSHEKPQSIAVSKQSWKDQNKDLFFQVGISHFEFKESNKIFNLFLNI